MIFVRVFFIVAVVSLIVSCKKDTCRITRYDLAYSYFLYKNGIQESFLTVWKIPPNPSSPIPAEVKDSMNKLRQNGYELIVPQSNFIVYEFADCEDCDKLKNLNVEHECKKHE